MRSPAPHALVLALLTLGWPIFADAQPRVVSEPGGPAWVAGGWWRQADGLPQDRVTVLKQSRDGYLWIGTRNGVGRFDGETVTTWNPGTPDAPPEGEVYSIAEASAGDLWLTVYGGGLSHYDRGRFSALDAARGLSDNYARAVAVGPDGSVWVGTDRGLNRLQAGRFSTFHAGDGPASDAIRSVMVDADGAVYAGADRGLYRVAGSGLVRVPLPIPADRAAVESLVRDRRGRLWVATSNGLVCLDGPKAEVLGPAQGVSASSVRHVYEDSAGRIWVATMNGVDCAEPEGTGGPHFLPVLTGGDATAILEDREHSVWVGFRGHGLLRLRRSLFAVYGVGRGLSSDSTSTVFQARNGAMWIGSGTGLSVVMNGALTNFAAADGLPDRAVSSLAEDESGRIWVGTEVGLFRSVAPVTYARGRCGARFAAVGGHPALREHIRVLRVGVDVLLAGTNSSGVLAIPLSAGGAVARIADGEVRAMLIEAPSRLWIGTRDTGLSLVTPDGVTRYTTANGLPHITVQSLHAGSDGTLWIGTRRGLAWLREGRIASVTAQEGLHQNHVYGITSDRSGRLWLSSGNGVSTAHPRELYDVAAGRQKTLAPTVLGAEHGLPTTLCALSHDPVITTDARGLVWIATLGGAVSIDPGRLPPDPAPPRVLVESATIESTAVGPGDTAEAGHRRGSLVFKFTAPTFVTPGRTRYRYRLSGLDPTWDESGSSREARYTNIPPGEYVFEVAAAHGVGPWGDPASLNVRLTPRVSQRTWFRVFEGLVALGVVLACAFAFYQVRIRRMRARERELAARVEESLAQIKVLRGMLPTCAWCKRVRDENGAWTQMELYVRSHSQAEFSHGLCPDCMAQNFPDETPVVGATPPEDATSRSGA